MQIRRGDVFLVSFGKRPGHEQQGQRPAIVVQADLYCVLSTLWIIPTSTGAWPDIEFHVPVEVQGRQTLALVEQLTTVDKHRRIKPERYLGHLSDDEMEEIDEMMRIFGGLDPNFGLRF
jgi:mRNA-degrading endonuclease toxin of MazEF toxin-antitoxin module